MRALKGNILILRTKVTLMAVAVSIIASVFLASKSLAATDMATTNTTTIAASVSETQKIFSLNTSLTYSTNMYAEGEYDKYSSTTLSVIPSIQLNKKTNLSVSTNFIKEQTGAENFLMTNTTVRLSHQTAKITPQLSWKNRLDGILPTNRDSQLIDRLQGAVGIGTSLSYNNKNKTLPFSFSGSLALQRNFHEYDLNADGIKNNAYGLTQGLSLDLSLTENLSLGIAGNYRTAINYDDKAKYAFDTTIDLSFAFNDNTGISTGVTNGGSALKANGIDSNMSFVDEKSSEVYLGFNLTI